MPGNIIKYQEYSRILALNIWDIVDKAGNGPTESKATSFRQTSEEEL